MLGPPQRTWAALPLCEKESCAFCAAAATRQRQGRAVCLDVWMLERCASSGPYYSAPSEWALSLLRGTAEGSAQEPVRGSRSGAA
jgi:hypothetical protein